MFEDNWEKIRKGYEFVVLIGDAILGVDYFNNVVLGGNKTEEDSQEIKINFDDISSDGVVVSDVEADCHICMKRNNNRFIIRRCQKECYGSSADVE